MQECPRPNKTGETLALPEFKNNACYDRMANELTNGTQSDRCVDLYKELDNTSKLSGTCKKDSLVHQLRLSQGFL